MGGRYIPSAERGKPTCAPVGIACSQGADIALPDLSKVMEAFKSRANVGLTYIIDRETHSVIIKVIDRETNEVIREIPSEEMTKLRAVMRDLQGLLLKTQA